MGKPDTSQRSGEGQRGKDRLKEKLEVNIPIYEHTSPLGKPCLGFIGTRYKTEFGKEIIVCDACSKEGVIKELL
ncbi:MAG TPA: hypothetical protein DCX25_00335 [Candidatus Pacebacteria bacterium]|nr:MAG: hypothetical protein UX00_C0003G0052 [Microgenomates group bacterium GW2011_GWB1_45_17]KKU24142.1 MAG: hypothetical protein UX36_C0002G0125 [Microgenomates group bacterium GW2011_GWC1_46_15]KKU24857.1 MAG: hypothetical protein UX35_C0001G0039 [Microgenomates group bacterium GW2011_GWA1_46_15]HAV14768.1 hypothetical protein [Candidatus Paceibacterota bacterium]HCR11474.1 hypothetical protein [Candidatus Paceibacterota bacterium]